MGFYFNKWFKPNVDDNSVASPSEHTRHPCQTRPRWPPERYRNPPRTSQASSYALSFRKSSFSDQNVGPILGKPYVDINTIYDVDRELGRGQFGITYLCTEKTTGLKYACKSISKTKIVNEKSVEDVRREIQILEHLRGQPNIVEFKGAYEDRHNLHLVIQLCSGGELFDRIIGKRTYSEREAAVIMRQIVNVVHACHSMGVMHRDLKPENFLFVDKADDSPLKATDFGLSVFIQEGLVYRDLVGSAYYIAPEVLNRNYGKEMDVWSAGVILYILLSGTPPFWAENEEGIFEEILKGQLDLESPPWPNISCSAKDIIRKMLARNPKERITAAQALEHPWLKVEREAKSRQCHFKVLLSQRRPCFKTTL